MRADSRELPRRPAPDELQRARDEVQRLRGDVSVLEAAKRELEERYVRAQQQNGSLARMYIAAHGLVSTLDVTAIVERVREIVINFVGSETFGVYVVDEAAANVVLAGGEGEVSQRLHAHSLVEKAVTTGEVAVANSSEPVACAPFAIHGCVVGVVVLQRLLDHKEHLDDGDRALLELVAAQAASALYTARLHANARHQLATPQKFIELLRG